MHAPTTLSLARQRILTGYAIPAVLALGLLALRASHADWGKGGGVLIFLTVVVAVPVATALLTLGTLGAAVAVRRGLAARRAALALTLAGGIGAAAGLALCTIVVLNVLRDSMLP